MRVTSGQTLTTPPPIVAPPRTAVAVTPPPLQRDPITPRPDASIHARATDSRSDAERGAYQADWIGFSIGSLIGLSLLLGLVSFIGWGPITGSSTTREAALGGQVVGIDRALTSVPSHQLAGAKFAAGSDARGKPVEEEPAEQEPIEEGFSEDESEQPESSAVVSVSAGMISAPSTTNHSDLLVEDKDVATGVVAAVTPALGTETQSPTEFLVSADVTVTDVTAVDGFADSLLGVELQDLEATTTQLETSEDGDQVVHAESSEASEVQQPGGGLAARDQEPFSLSSLTSVQPSPTFPSPPTCVDGQCQTSQTPETQTPETQSHGTALEWVESPELAYVQAREQNKLVFLIHISGNFEIPGFT